MRRIVWVGLFGLAVVGCGKEPVAEKPAEPPAQAAESSPAPRPDLNQPFDQAATTAAPDESLPPADRTLAGKPTAPLQLAVRKVWDAIQLPDRPDEPVRVVLTTDLGEVEITLFPDVAPNHVRNFLALAKVGFYDGLVFERVVRQEFVAAGGEKTRIEFVTAGTPDGVGLPGTGHLGYFLKPEFSDVTHTEGTVGFWRDDADASAGTRFYITLGPSPLMDGKYTVVGQVSRGLDVVRAIADRPLAAPEFERPESPVVIRKAIAE
jgi:peptidyl-prolyl cis-trans isomerase B (cyclophilin B)